MRKQPDQFKEYAFQGFLLGLLPANILTVCADNPLFAGRFSFLPGVFASVLLFAGISMIFKFRKWGKTLFASGILLNLFILFFEFLNNPLLTLFCLLLSIMAFYYLFTARLYPAQNSGSFLQLERVIGWSFSGILLSVTAPLFMAELKYFPLVCSVNLAVGLLLLGKYCRKEPALRKWKSLFLLFLPAGGILLYVSWYGGSILTLFLTAPLVLLFALRYKHTDWKYLELILAHPARSLVLTFLVLCIGGTLLLRTPWAVRTDMSVSDAAFTAVSAVCVTGLTVIDISETLTIRGQFFLLILIQLGGLGMMTLATLALHSIGKLSLSGEQVITELTQSGDQDVFDSLRLIVRFTLCVELFCALLLTLGFFQFHGDWFLACRQGIFTSVSAFCNAGFFPGADSLMPYAGEKFLLTVIALEIITGGIAPAVIWSALKVRRSHQFPMVCRIILGTTAILIAAGTFLLLLFEWNGIFDTLAWHDKLFNGFFQSVTLRTAGFNSVSFASLGLPAYLVMIFLMFIGGSPGGTAGGIKTTALALLFYTFRAAVRNEENVTAGQYRIAWRNIIQAVAVLVAASLVLASVIIMLLTTQTVEGKKLIFEAVSALATVGLSLNCTGELDTVGRMIIMGAMFVGRIGPLTLFCILSENQNRMRTGYPQIKIPMG